jgi:hypothetical protein
VDRSAMEAKAATVNETLGYGPLNALSTRSDTTQNKEGRERSTVGSDFLLDTHRASGTKIGK